MITCRGQKITHKDRQKNARQTLVHLDRKRELKKQGVMPEQPEDGDFYTDSQQKPFKGCRLPVANRIGLTR